MTRNSSSFFLLPKPAVTPFSSQNLFLHLQNLKIMTKFLMCDQATVFDKSKLLRLVSSKNAPNSKQISAVKVNYSHGLQIL